MTALVSSLQERGEHRDQLPRSFRRHGQPRSDSCFAGQPFVGLDVDLPLIEADYPRAYGKRSDDFRLGYRQRLVAILSHVNPAKSKIVDHLLRCSSPRPTAIIPDNRRARLVKNARCGLLFSPVRYISRALALPPATRVQRGLTSAQPVGLRTPNSEFWRAAVLPSLRTSPSCRAMQDLAGISSRRKPLRLPPFARNLFSQRAAVSHPASSWPIPSGFARQLRANAAFYPRESNQRQNQGQPSMAALDGVVSRRAATRYAAPAGRECPAPISHPHRASPVRLGRRSPSVLLPGRAGDRRSLLVVVVHRHPSLCLRLGSVRLVSGEPKSGAFGDVQKTRVCRD